MPASKASYTCEPPHANSEGIVTDNMQSVLAHSNQFRSRFWLLYFAHFSFFFALSHINKPVCEIALLLTGNLFSNCVYAVAVLFQYEGNFLEIEKIGRHTSV